MIRVHVKVEEYWYSRPLVLSDNVDSLEIMGTITLPKCTVGVLVWIEEFISTDALYKV